MSDSLRAAPLLLVLWAAVTVPFLGKAFHIDDPVHVRQAGHVAAHPTRPLDLEIFWFEWPEWLADSNPVTPPVWQYELALAVRLFGAREPVLAAASALHLLVLAIAVWALAARVLDAPIIAAALVLTSPAAVVGRNVMLDIPMLSYLVAGLAAVTAGLATERRALAATGAVLIGLSSVTKLPGVVGIVVLLAVLVRERRWRQLPHVVVAMAPLGIWYAYQLAATGGIDILRPRGGGGFDPRYSVGASVAILVAHLPFWGGAIFTGAAYLAAILSRRPRWLVAFALGAGGMVGLARRWPGAVTPAEILWGLFAIGGAALLVGAARGFAQLARGDAARRGLGAMLALWTAGHVAFAVAGGWEMNVRFAILSALLATILCLVEIEAVGRSVRRRWARWAPTVVAVVGGGVLSGLVAWTDMQWADGYRRLASEVATQYAGQRVWFVGHWGFQHYATAAGLRPYVPRDHRLEPGDMMIIPFNVARQRVPDEVMERLSVVAWHGIAPTLPLRTMGSGGGFYSTGWGAAPWGWSHEPQDLVVVTRYE